MQLWGGLKTILSTEFSDSRQFHDAVPVRSPGQAPVRCMRGTQFPIKLPTHVTDTTHTLSPMCILFDFSIGKTPGNMLDPDEKQGVYKLVKKYDIYPVS